MTWLLLALMIGTDTSSPGYDPAELAPVAVPEATPLAMDYYRSGVVLWFVVHAWQLLVPAVILFSGLSGRMQRLAQGLVFPGGPDSLLSGWRSHKRLAGGAARELGQGESPDLLSLRDPDNKLSGPPEDGRTTAARAGLDWFATIAVYALLYLGLTFLIDLPIDYYLGYVRPHRYGLSNQTPGRWIEQGLKGLAVTAAVAVLFLWVPYLLLARSPRRWWLWLGLLTLPFAVGGAIVKPIWIDPLFHDFGPMKDRALEAKILAQAERAGIDGGRVFEVDMSRDTTTVNAYVTGLFGTKRIVLWDTLLDRLDEKETLAVMGHEMGHYVLNHVAWGVGLATLGSLVLLFLVDRVGRALVRRFGPRFGFDSLADVASVPLMILLLSAFNLVGAPVQLAVSRTMEHEADRFGLEITRTNHSAATSFVKLQHENLSNPRPGWLSVLWRSSHPSIGDRIDFCNAYHPWAEGRPGQYIGAAPPPSQ
jgi:Zn-dependent protease with chaperone function